MLNCSNASGSQRTGDRWTGENMRTDHANVVDVCASVNFQDWPSIELKSKELEQVHMSKRARVHLKEIDLPRPQADFGAQCQRFASKRHVEGSRVSGPV